MQYRRHSQKKGDDIFQTFMKDVTEVRTHQGTKEISFFKQQEKLLEQIE